MLDEFMQDQAEVVWSGDQEVVETLAAQRANPAFRDGVSWCSYRGADDAAADAGEHRVERGGELGMRRAAVDDLVITLVDLRERPLPGPLDQTRWGAIASCRS
jgi:hypothetical protein